ncbi:MAG: YafY family transcriptional regulator [Opitutaceae bacterium]|nr:YafY family transcriptional regulator [Opitutaceae bacterium]
MNRTDRLVAMVMFLQGRRLVRAQELAEHFEISLRTVYRDMAALGEAGVPIAGEAGVGYSLVKGYHLPPVMLTADEASALFVGAELVKEFTDASFGGPMMSALDKLRAVLPRERQDQVERLVRQTVIMGRSGNVAVNPAAQTWLLPVQRGVVQRRVLQLRYRGRERAEETMRAVEPLGVVFYGGAWYLVAWCRLRRDFRQFRIDRIRELTEAGEIFPVRPDFSLREHLAREEAAADTIPTRIWLAAEVQERARAESYATLSEERARDGGAEFSLFTFSIEWLARWLLSFGPAAEALDPPELRERVADLARETVRRYG